MLVEAMGALGVETMYRITETYLPLAGEVKG
jgi:hypothetical protein